jgi:hydrogenase small subunit
MRLSRRDFLKLAGATGVLTALPIDLINKALGGNGDPRVIWLQGQSCTGCSVSLLNSIKTTTIDDILLNYINLEYHSTLIASAGELALSGAFGPHPNLTELTDFGQHWLEDGQGLKYDLNGDGRVNLIDFNALCKQGYVLVVEGSIPTGSDGLFCEIGGDITMTQAFDTLSQKADKILAVGTCAAFGGIPGANPNPTTALGVSAMLTQLGYSKPVINIPGCPIHPDWFVETLIDLLTGQTIALDAYNRPLKHFPVKKIHESCPFKGTNEVHILGGGGCLKEIGCRGPNTHADCHIRKWNSPAQGQNGVNWCINARTPCIGCVEPNFPDGMTPFIKNDD